MKQFAQQTVKELGQFVSFLWGKQLCLKQVLLKVDTSVIIVYCDSNMLHCYIGCWAN